MTTESLNQEQAEAIWNELDSEDAGQPVSESEQHEAAQSAQDDTAPQQEAAEAASKTPAADDPYADLPEHVRDKLVGLETLTTQLQGRLRNVEGHVGGLKSQLTAAREVRATGGDAPSAQQIKDAQGDPAAFERLKEDYPEFAEAISTYVRGQISQNKPAEQFTPEKLAEMRAEITKEVRADLEREIAVEVRHPGWKATIQTPEFRGWYERQEREVKLLASSPNPGDAIRLLDKYAEARTTRAKPNRALQAAAALPGSRASGSRLKSEDEMTPEELWAHLDALEAQQASRR